MGILTVAPGGRAAGPLEPPLKEQREQLGQRAVRLAQQAARLTQKGHYAPATKLWLQVLDICERLYPADKHPEGHPDLAVCLSNLGFLLRAQGDYAAALPYSRRALDMTGRLYPKDKYPQGHDHLAICLNNLAHVLQSGGDYAGALGYYRKALAMYERLYPESKYPRGNPHLAQSLNNLGVLVHDRGDYAGALRYLHKALAMRQRLYPKGTYPDGHPDLAQSFTNLASLLQDRGDYAGAHEYRKKALAMYERLYPEDKFPGGHPALATSLNNLGIQAQVRGDYPNARGYYRKALAMYERLYPEAKYPAGHPDLAKSLNNLGALSGYQGDYAAARGYYRKALAMYERLYPEAKHPDGHPATANTLNNLGFLLHTRGDYAGARGYYQKALAMRQRLYPVSKYPNGHPELALSLNNLGSLMFDRGDYAAALGYVRNALAMGERLADLFAEASAEAQALTFAASLPLTRDGLLSATRHLPGTDADAYAAVWRSKAAVTRCLERRQRSLAQALGSQEMSSSRRKEIEQMWLKLRNTRRVLARLLLSPPADADDHRRRARRLTQDKEHVEGQLARLLPAFARRQALARQGHAALVEKLPPATVFIDLVRYVFYEQDPQHPGKAGQRQRVCYAAFVLRRGRPVRRVELGPAAPIEKALAAWRADIRAQRDGPAAQQVRRLLGQPLAQQVPAGTRTVLLCPEGALTRVPWPALPVGKAGRVLLEDWASAVVPHAPFLLERLTEPTATAADAGQLLAVGDVHYDAKPREAQRDEALALLRSAERGDRSVTWNDLPGTARELDRVVQRAGKRAVRRLSGGEASTARLLAELPKARWAHIATHGFFADAKFRSALRLDEKLFAGHGFRGGLPPGARNPLVLSGLVLAGANVALPKDPDARLSSDSGILTAEAIASLPLHRLELAVLSACETGLGEVAGGEGVFGLQRAFHLAGARNVVASLWKVDDQATAALMALFYDKMWRQNKPPLEALREAQLTLYRYPKRIDVLAKERGPNFDKVVRLSARPAKGGNAHPEGKAATKLWAAFVLSGLGR
jgi:CHAT domain-containing protein/Tfp pilus assembly protein PilF